MPFQFQSAKQSSVKILQDSQDVAEHISYHGYSGLLREHALRERGSQQEASNFANLGPQLMPLEVIPNRKVKKIMALIPRFPIQSLWTR
jgi:hypothetical protein